MHELALVTGASSGIGKAISRRLISLGYEVYGIGRTFCSEDPIQSPLFHPVELDLLDTAAWERFAASLPHDRLRVLINNAGTAWYGPLETLHAEEIQNMCRTDLEVPILICNSLLRTLKRNRGYIINICSVTALSVSTHGAVYGACKAGLLHFSRTLFEEHRKSGLRVSAILPDMTETALYRNADFTADSSFGASLSPQDTADAVETILRQREGTVISELVLRPQLHRILRKPR